MAGGMLGGGGDAWAKDHPEILEHARGLGYDKVEGVSLPPADAPKETWISAMDKFNAWKASELAKPEASRWWVTRPWSSTEGTVSPEGSGGGGGASVARPTVASSPVPSNPYYPQLVQEYEAPSLMDYSAYMPADSLFGYDQYQPYTNPNAIDSSIFNYQPPTIYATDPRISLGGLARTSGVGGRIMPTRPMGGGSAGGGGMGSASESASASSGSGIFDSEGNYQPDKDVVPGTSGVTVQDLFDYESKGMETPIYNDQGVQDRRYFVPPDMRADIVQQDIQRAKEEAYIKAAQPVNVPINVGRINPLTPEEVIEWTRIPSGSPWVQDQLNDEINRVTNLIDFRPTSREEAQQGGGGGSSQNQGVFGIGRGMGTAAAGGYGSVSGGGHTYGGDRGNPRGGGT